MDDFSYDPQESLGFMTITVNRLMSASLRRKMREDGIDLTAEQWGVLVLLWNRHGATQAELAQTCCVDKSSMSRVLALMEIKDLIIRRTDPADGRRKIIRPSEKALQLRRGALAVVSHVMDNALRNISRQDRELCLNVLNTVRENLRHGEDSLPPEPSA